MSINRDKGHGEQSGRQPNSMRADWEMQLEAPPADTHYKTEDATATKGNELEGYLLKRGLLMRLHGEKGFGRPCCKSTILQFRIPSGGNYRQSLTTRASIYARRCCSPPESGITGNHTNHSIPVIPFQYYNVAITTNYSIPEKASIEQLTMEE